MHTTKSLTAVAAVLLTLISVKAQTPGVYVPNMNDDPLEDEIIEYIVCADSIEVEKPEYASLTDSLLCCVTDVDSLVNLQPLPRTFFLPAVFKSYNVKEDRTPFKSDYSGNEALRWIEDADALAQRQQQMLQEVIVTNPYAIRYNIGMLPEAPKQYDVIIDPEHYKIDIVEHLTTPTDLTTTLEQEAINKKHWLHTFNGNLQFSQAYVSPNWYQGGNNNLNMLLDLNWNVKLNQKFHPNLLFETNVQYKLGLYSTPEDSLRSYNISQDLFQANSTFGIKAIKKWYYTVNAQFKTQLFDNYPINTRNLRAALLSPAELNVGVGMTYNTANAKKTFTFDASISPLSYNLLICTDGRLNVTNFGIEAGHKTKSKYGSSVECKLGLKLTNNISLKSRLFAFTDYDRAYADLENTMVFEINKYLTTQLFVHLRYDTTTPYVDPDWHKLQVKEILSLGFTYKFSTI